jgi:transketolase
VTDTAAAAHAARRLVLEAALAAGTCHIGSSLSLVDIGTVLYLKVMRDPAGQPDGTPGDRFLLSKGHAASGFYSVLAQAGVLTRRQVLDGYCRDGGTLAGHPERGYPGVEITGGSLGHGPSIAVGMALADRQDGSDRRTFCLIGDGELNEGSVWEAIALAGHLRLSNLTLIVDANGFQGLGSVGDVLDMEPLAAKLASFGWSAADIDGHDHATLERVLGIRDGSPRAVVARTVKAYGVGFLEGDVMSHYKSFKPHDRDLLLGALEERQAA